MKHFYYTFFFYLLTASFGFQMAAAQNPSLVADINTTQLIPAPDYYGRLNASDELLLFNATDNHGFGLWRTDGTTEGTFFLTTAVTLIGENTSVTYNGEILFDGSDGNLWKTDGTTEGTLLVKTFGQALIGSANGSPELNGFIYFSAATEEDVNALWRTDGTSDGTTEVSDISPSQLTLLNDHIVFSGYSSTTGNEPYITDGTESGTMILKDIYPGVNGSQPVHFSVLNGEAYFFANQVGNAATLWKTDGSSSGTELVKIFAPDEPFYGGLKMSTVNDKLLIYALKEDKGYELWVSDGTTDGTQFLYDIYPGTIGSNYGGTPPDFFVLNGVAYFPANTSPNHTEFWRSDGTVPGTHVVKNIMGDAPLNFTALPGGKFVFTIYSFSNDQLWVSDGTSSGTFSINKQFYDNQGLLSPVSFDGHVFFVVRGPTSLSTQLCYTDGTLSGTNAFPIISGENNSSTPTPMIRLDEGKYVLVANDGIHGRELFVTDGTSGAELIADIIGGISSSTYSFSPHTIDGVAFFASADTIISNLYKDYKLWKTDGTSQGTVPVKAANPRFDVRSAVLNGKLYFINQVTTSNSTELWVSDGTSNGTHVVKDINPSGNDQAGSMVMFNNAIYFSADDGVHGAELWKTDGSTEGTVMVKDINPGALGSGPNYLTVFNNKLFFGTGGGLWTSDGTSEGTLFLNSSTLVYFNNSGMVFASAGDYLYYYGNTNAYGSELWKTDGTVEGTQMVKDIKNGAGSTSITAMIGVNEILFFVVITPLGDFQLWKSDGTVSGTVKFINFLPDYTGASDLTDVNGVLYFVMENATSKVLWRTDGTACHTGTLDFYPEGDDRADILLADSNTIFLGLRSEPLGTELWRYVAVPLSNTEICNGLDDDCDGMIDDDVITAVISPAGMISVCKGDKVNFMTANTGADLSYQWFKNDEAISGATNPTYVTNKNESGSFTLQVTSAFGCSDLSDATEIIRLDKPTASITALGNTDICETGFVSLMASSGIGYTYSWAVNGVRITGATNQGYHATAPGKYRVLIKSSDGCTGLSGATVITSSCRLSGNQVVDVEIYPNPAADILNVRVEPFTAGTLTITNLIGETLIRQSYASPDVTVDLSSLIPGAYLLQVETAEGKSVKMFTKE